MKKENYPKPQNPKGKIVEIKSKEDFVKYIGNESLEKMNASLIGTQKFEDYLPFFIEYISSDGTYYIDKDETFKAMPVVINCSNLVFDGGSITSYVQLKISTTNTTLQNLSKVNNYQILVLGSMGANGSGGDAGVNGKDGDVGSNKYNENGGDGGQGGPGSKGTQGKDGGYGGDTPKSDMTLGSITLGVNYLFTIIAQGGDGGNGGVGGTGGSGGSGGVGGNTDTSSCSGYDGGKGGNGGPGGAGGDGGDGGYGSINNYPMTITVATDADKNKIATNTIPGGRGLPGNGGTGGSGGTYGGGGNGSICNGQNGVQGTTGVGGIKGTDGVSGSLGSMPTITIASAE